MSLLTEAEESLHTDEELEGVIENVIYANEQNGYAVCELDTGDELVTVVGIMPYINAGESIKARGKWETHASYGKQFKVEYYEKQLPSSAETMIKYLSSGVIKGVGAVTAKRIVEQFGEDTFDVIESHPEWLSDIKGINPKKAQEISDSFKSQFGVRSIMMFCRDFFGPATIMKIYKKWGSGAVDTINRNPYCLCDEIYGIGFDKADSLAVLGRNKVNIYTNGEIYQLKGKPSFSGLKLVNTYYSYRGRLKEENNEFLGL